MVRTILQLTPLEKPIQYLLSSSTPVDKGYEPPASSNRINRKEAFLTFGSVPWTECAKKVVLD